MLFGLEISEDQNPSGLNLGTTAGVAVGGTGAMGGPDNNANAVDQCLVAVLTSLTSRVVILEELDKARGSERLSDAIPF